MGKLFGTDGVRGIANLELTAEMAFKLGQAGAHVLTKTFKDKTPKILIAKDTRVSCDMLEMALAAGVCSVGAKVRILGVVPTPATAYLIKKYKADAGIVISASHNPMEYNGIKFFSSEGYKLSDAIEDEIENIILNNRLVPLAQGGDIGKYKVYHNAANDYIEFAQNSIDVNLKGLKISVDCANGANSYVAPETFLNLGANIDVIHNTPDGTNINAGCGSLYTADLASRVINVGADIGIAFDGDADRVLAVDELGNLVDGDVIMMICAKFMKEQGKLKNNTIVATVMSNLGLFIAGEENDINIEKTTVGDRYVLERMVEGDFSIGGEQSGHIIMREFNTTGDGLITALQLLSIMKKTGKTLSQLAKCITIMPQVLINAKVVTSKKNDYVNDDEINAAISVLEEKFHGKGRVLIRPSGTEPLVRVMIEGADQEYITKKARALADLIEKKLG